MTLLDPDRLHHSFGWLIACFAISTFAYAALLDDDPEPAGRHLSDGSVAGQRPGRHGAGIGTIASQASARSGTRN